MKMIKHMVMLAMLTIAANAKVDEGGLNTRLEIYDPSFVNIANVIVLAGAFDVQFFQNVVLNNRDPTLLGLSDIDEHFLLHVGPFLCRSLRTSAVVVAMSCSL